MDHEWSSAEARRIETIFERVRLEEYPASPSRRSCIFLFDFVPDPDKYAASMSLIQVREELTLVEVDTEDHDSRLARVDKSLLSHRLDSEGQLIGTDEEIMSDAREYWTCTTKSDYNTEILFFGTFKFTRIIRKAERPLIKTTYSAIVLRAIT